MLGVTVRVRVGWLGLGLGQGIDFWARALT